MNGNPGNIDFFFNPRSVALIGATVVPGKLSSIILDSLVASGFKGKIFPVNPKYEKIGERTCYPSLEAIGEPVDVAIIALPAPLVPGVLRGAGEGRLRGAVIVGGGFAEAGEEGRALEREIREIVRQTGIRVIGPNCMGIYDPASGLDTFFISRERIKRPGQGRLSIISQSGSFAITAMDELATEGIGISRVVSYGNRADVNESDCLDFLAEDPLTGAVAVYVESIDEGRRFVEAASRCSAKKPVFAVKVGRGGAAVSAARSHTGAIAGRYEVYRAAFRKAGVIEVNGYEEFITACKALSVSAPAAGKRVMIITDGGGMGVGIADACFEAGLEAPELGADLMEELRSAYPPYFGIGNPLDLTGSATDEMYAEALEKTMSSGLYDMAIVAALWGPPGLSDGLAEAVSKRAALIGKPVLICSPGGEYTKNKSELFRKAGLPVFPTPESAVRAAKVLAGGTSMRSVKTGG